MAKRGFRSGLILIRRLRIQDETARARRRWSRSVKGGQKGFRHQRVGKDDEVGEYEEGNTSYSPKGAGKKPAAPPQEGPCLHYAPGAHPRHERAHFWDSGAKNEVD